MKNEEIGLISEKEVIAEHFATRSGFLQALAQKAEDWNAFMTSRIINPSVNPIVAQSWIRSKARNIDSYELHPPQLTEKEFTQLCDKNNALLQCAVPLLKKLMELGSNHISLISLHDANGYMLLLNDMQSAETSWRDECFRPGVCWREDTVGTNGIGLVLLEKKAIQLIGQEHYCYQQKNICCCAAPIFDENHEVLAVLNVCAQADNFSRHMMTLVILSCYAISNQMSARRDFEIDKRVLSTISEGVMVLDRHNSIIRCSEYAAGLFGVQAGMLLGYHIQDIIHMPELERFLKSGEQKSCCFQDCSSFFNGRQILCEVTVTPVFEDGQRFCTVLLIRNSKTLAKTIASSLGCGLRYSFDDIPTQDERLLQQIAQMRAMADSDRPILLVGESGTGKELYANAIHSSGRRANEPFISINCAALPIRSLDHELYGYESETGQTGAQSGVPGRFEIADHGTIFIDGIEQLPLYTQQRLLRIMTSGKLSRSGELVGREIDVRIIAATHADLQEAVKQKIFLPELYEMFRRSTFEILPLRERPKDIELLARQTVSYLNTVENTQKVLTDEAALELQKYPWNGNGRELQAVVSSAFYCCESRQIGIEHFQAMLEKEPVQRPADPRKNAVLQKEREACEAAMRSCGNDVNQAAILLGVSRATLYRKIKKYGLHKKNDA